MRYPRRVADGRQARAVSGCASPPLPGRGWGEGPGAFPGRCSPRPACRAVLRSSALRLIDDPPFLGSRCHPQECRRQLWGLERSLPRCSPSGDHSWDGCVLEHGVARGLSRACCPKVTAGTVSFPRNGHLCVQSCGWPAAIRRLNCLQDFIGRQVLDSQGIHSTNRRSAHQRHHGIRRSRGCSAGPGSAKQRFKSR